MGNKMRILASLLFAAALFASCGGGNPETPMKSGTENETDESGGLADARISDDLPAVDYGGYEYRILTQGAGADDTSWIDFMADESRSGEVLNDAVYARNLEVEERFNITIKLTMETYENMPSSIKKSIASGQDEWDLFMVQMVQGGAMALNGDFLPVNALANVDLGKPWWDNQINKSYVIGKNVMFANGAISPMSYLCTSAVLFNKNLFGNYGIDYPYDEVKAGKWTFDGMRQTIKGAAQDLNSDGKLTPDSDFFGFLAFCNDTPYSFYYGAGGMIVEHDFENMPYLTDDLNKATTIAEKLFDIIWGGDSFYQATGTADGLRDMLVAFNGGRSLFTSILFDHIKRYLAEMENDYGVLPIPKLDEAQPNYLSFVNGASPMVAIPRTVGETDRTGIVLEALASSSYYRVKPVLYDNILKVRTARDEDSEEMIDIIFADRVFDMGYSYMLPGYGAFMRELMDKKSVNVASTWEKNETSAKRQLDKIVDSYQQNN